MSFQVTQSKTGPLTAALLDDSSRKAVSNKSGGADFFTGEVKPAAPGIRPDLSMSTSRFGKISPMRVADVGAAGQDAGDAADATDTPSDTASDDSGGSEAEISVSVGGSVDVGIGEVHAEVEYSGPAPSCTLTPEPDGD